jgi:osmotically inducible lipoprotein OsmB
MKTATQATIIVILCAGLSACASWSPSEQGTAIGATTGAVVGNALTGGALGIIGGAAAGGFVGHEIGENQEKKQRR